MSTAVYYRWEQSGRARTLWLYTDRESNLLPRLSALPHDPARVWSRHRIDGTLHPWIEMKEREYFPTTALLVWTLYEWLFLRRHITADADLSDDESHQFVASFWQTQVDQRIPYTIVGPLRETVNGEWTARCCGTATAARYCLWTTTTPRFEGSDVRWQTRDVAALIEVPMDSPGYYTPLRANIPDAPRQKTHEQSQLSAPSGARARAPNLRIRDAIRAAIR